MPVSPHGLTSAVPQSPDAPEARCRDWYEAHGQVVYRFVRFHLPSADQAEDVTSDTFLKAFRNADRYDPARGSVRSWLIRIARNTLRDHLRRARVRRHLPLSGFRDLVWEAPSAEERLLHEERVGRLLEAVAALSRADAELISLRYGSGLDTPAIAEVLEIGESAVRTRLWRALARLRGLLGEEP